mmetsp:Transcript_72624/g.155530  ORF Transcript_72624/g.155530 Transcript_72624/m.155530 type:complete len:208 (+) Transcript_72624:127-750(+)
MVMRSKSLLGTIAACNDGVETLEYICEGICDVTGGPIITVPCVVGGAAKSSGACGCMGGSIPACGCGGGIQDGGALPICGPPMGRGYPMFGVPSGTNMGMSGCAASMSSGNFRNEICSSSKSSSSSSSSSSLQALPLSTFFTIPRVALCLFWPMLVQTASPKPAEQGIARRKNHTTPGMPPPPTCAVVVVVMVVKVVEVGGKVWMAA